ncbi:MAG: FHIPEP family type III secretion protein [Bryobacteraceae bacterium]
MEKSARSAESGPPQVAIRIEIAPFLASLAAGPHRDSIVRGVAADLDALLADLGLQGKAGIVVATSTDARPLRLLLSGRYRGAAHELLVEAWRRADPEDTISPPSHGFYHWLERRLASPNHLRPEMLADVVESVCCRILRNHPEDLLASEQAAELLERGLLLLDPRRAKALAPLNPARLLAILRPALELRMSLARPVTVFQTIADGLLEGKTGEDTAENLISRLGGKGVRVRLAPETLAALFPGLEAPFSITNPKIGEDIKRIFGGVRDRTFGELGVRVPEIIFESDGECSWTQVQVAVNDSFTPPEETPFDYWWSADEDRVSNLANAIFGVIRRHAWLLITSDVVETELSLLDEDHPALAAAAARGLSVGWIARVLRAMLREGVPILDFATILERLLTFDWVPARTLETVVFDDRLAMDRKLAALGPPTETEMIDYVRLGLKRGIVLNHTRYLRTLNAYELAPAAQAILLGHLAASRGASDTPMLPAGELSRLVTSIRQKVEPSLGVHPPAILTAGSIRALVRELIADEVPGAAVFSYEEVELADISVQVAGSIGWPGTTTVAM